jgi:hypothetical protein
VHRHGACFSEVIEIINVGAVKSDETGAIIVNTKSSVTVRRRA